MLVSLTGGTIMTKRIRFEIPKEYYKHIQERAKALGKTVEQLFQEAVTVLLRESWLYEPANKDLVDEVKQSLKEPATIDLGTFKQYVC